MPSRARPAPAPMPAHRARSGRDRHGAAATATPLQPPLDLHIGDAVDRVEHLEHRIAAPIAAIERVAGRRIADQQVERIDMRRRQVADMDIVAHPGAVGRFEVGPEHADMAALARRGLDRDLDEVGGPRGRLARSPLGVGTRHVEIAQRAIVDRMGRRDVVQHDLRHQLRHAIGIDRCLGRFLAHRHDLWNAIGRRGRREDEVAHPARDRTFDQRTARGGVVAVVFERIADRFGHDDRSGEVHDRGDRMFPKRRAHQRLVLDRALHQRRAWIDRPGKTRDEIVDHHHPPARIAKRQHRVAADIARAARHQHRPVAHHRSFISESSPVR